MYFVLVITGVQNIKRLSPDDLPGIAGFQLIFRLHLSTALLIQDEGNTRVGRRK